jgi:hypothetical protein
VSLFSLVVVRSIKCENNLRSAPILASRDSLDSKRFHGLLSRASVASQAASAIYDAACDATEARESRPWKRLLSRESRLARIGALRICFCSQIVLAFYTTNHYQTEQRHITMPKDRCKTKSKAGAGSSAWVPS